MAMGTDIERKLISDLTQLLKQNSEKVLSGEIRVTLTTSSISTLTTHFRRYSERDDEEERASGILGILQRSRVNQEAEKRKWRENIKILFDYITKLKSLKIINGQNTVKAPIHIARFQCLQILEVKKVPIHMVEGLSKLRNQISEMIVCRSIQNLQDILETCGGDRSSGMVWSSLKKGYFSFNGLQKLDNSLRFVPSLDMLDLSHNNLMKTDDYLQNLTSVTMVNIGYNMLSAVPQFSYSNKGLLRTLVLRNNNLDNLEGIQELTLLEELDVANNFLAGHGELKVLAGLNRLQVLCLVDNPLYHKSNHRTLTLAQICPLAGLGVFMLDLVPLTDNEVMMLRQNQYKKMHAQSSPVEGGIVVGVNQTDVPDNRTRNGGSTLPAGSTLTPGNGHAKKKKRGHKRTRSRERVPKIANIEESLMEENTPKSLPDSDSGSYRESDDVLTQIEEDKRKIEIMREHYKDGWLDALNAEHARNQESASPKPTTKDTLSGLEGPERRSPRHRSPSPRRSSRRKSASPRPRSSRSVTPVDKKGRRSPRPQGEESQHLKPGDEDSEVRNGADHIDAAGGAVVQNGEKTQDNLQKNSSPVKSTSGRPSPLPTSDKTPPPRTTGNSTPMSFITSSTVTPATSDSTPTIASPTVTSPTSPQIDIIETTDIYALSSASKYRNREDSDDEAEEIYERQKKNNEELYGMDSEPLIVMLPSEDMKQMLVSMNKRFITEKDLNGVKRSSLDLKCLTSFRHTSERLYGKDIIGGLVFSVLTLNFDYVRKDMRQRKYAMEDAKDAKVMESLLSDHLLARKREAELNDRVMCLKCQHKFLKHSTVSPSKVQQCPKCSSKMVVKDDSHLIVTDGTDSGGDQVSPVGSYKIIEEHEVEALTRSGSSPRLQRRKALKKRENETVPIGVNPERDAKFQEAYKAGSHNSVGRRGSALLQDCVENLMSHVSLSDQDLIGQDNHHDSSRLTKSTISDTDTSLTKSASTHSIEDSSAMKSNTSWSDVRKSSSGVGPRGSVSSVESDITILVEKNSSRGSISVISESSHEALSGHSYRNAGALKPDKASGRSSQADRVQGNAGSGSMDNTLGDNPGPVTPVGSPLSNSICSSMVSSVYENILAGGTDINASGENTHGSSYTSSSGESVSVRVSSAESIERKSRRSKHRTAVFINDDIDIHSDDKSRSLLGLENSHVKDEQDKTGSYDTQGGAIPTFQSSADVSLNTEQTTESIYSSATTDIETEESFKSVNQSVDSKGSPDLSLPNHSASSPFKRSGVSSRSSKNRSAIYMEETPKSLSENQTDTAQSNLLAFPSDLSPIKRSSSKRSSSRDNRSAIYLDDSSIPLSDDTDSVNINETSSASIGLPGSLPTNLLPWELEEEKRKEATNKDKRHESLIHDEFINIDHKIKLYLELNVLKADEMCQCAIECNIVQYMHPEEIKSLLVISSDRIFIFKKEGEFDNNNSEWLKSYEDQPTTELRYIDIGLGYQSLRLEFETECSSYTLLIADEGRCKKFLTLLQDIVRHAALSGHSMLEGITKSNPTTQANLELAVLSGGGATSLEEGPQEIVKYLIVKSLEEEEEKDRTMSLVVTNTDLVLMDENHQWPLPRLQAPLSECLKRKQFKVVHRELINNIETLMFNENNPRELRLSFFENSDTNSKPVWMIAMETAQGVKSFVDAIRDPWEQQFGVTLDITSTSFTDGE